MQERLQKFLARSGVASRREAEKMMLAGKVKVNGQIITELGFKIDPKQDKVYIDNQAIRPEKLVYLLFNKPKGVVTTLVDPEGRKTIADYLTGIKERVYPVGRLDYNTEGLLLLTNDGTLAQGLMHPKHHVNKTYLVTVVGIALEEQLDKLRIGVELEDGVTAPAIVQLVEYQHEKNLTVFTITIHEGKNRQVRRMCDCIGHPVRQLTRTKIANLNLSGLGRGKFRILNEQEVKALYKAAKLDG